MDIQSCTSSTSSSAVITSTATTSTAKIDGNGIMAKVGHIANQHQSREIPSSTITHAQNNTKSLPESLSPIPLTRIYTENRTPLMLAARNNDFKNIKTLIQRRADVNAQNQKGETALMYSSRLNRTDAMKLLIENGVDVNAQDKKGANALMYASRLNHTAAMKLLIENGADVNAQDNNGETALMYASRLNNTDAMKLLIEKGAGVADVNAQDYKGETALMHASRLNNTDYMKLLIEKGADVNAQDKKGETALMYASRLNHTDAMKLLIEKGADVNTKNSQGKTVLIQLADTYKRECNIEAIQILLDANADVDSTDNIGAAALIYAATHGNIDVITMLVSKYHATVDKVCSKYRTTPLMHASRSLYPECVKKLLALGADPSKKDKFGRLAAEIVDMNLAPTVCSIGATYDSTSDKTKMSIRQIKDILNAAILKRNSVDTNSEPAAKQRGSHGPADNAMSH